MPLVPLLVIAFSTTSALVTEFLQWYFVWRTPRFQALKANLAKHSRRVEEASASKNLKKKEQRLQNWRTEAGREMSALNFKASIVVRCRKRNQSPPSPAAARLFPTICYFLCALQMMFCMFATYKIMMRLFSGMGPVGRLPFEPLPFMQKVTHRGLEGAEARDCSAVRPAGAWWTPGTVAAWQALCARAFTHLALLTCPLPELPKQVFIFVLCQSSIRMVIGKLLNLGMGREFQVGGAVLSRQQPVPAGCTWHAWSLGQLGLPAAEQVWSSLPLPPAQDIMPTLPKGFPGLFEDEKKGK
jgi:hypothetical protein